MTQDRARGPDNMPSGSHSDVPSQAVGQGSMPDIRGVGTYFLGRYRVVDEIGIGGMASVHLARMDGPGGFQKWVAIKRIHAHLVEDESFIQMFLDEARVAARISHPNVATVFELGKHEDTYWIAMEYLHGEPLREVMRRTEETGQPMPPEIACRVIADAAEGLHAAHELLGKNGEKLGLVHRDVTPHNLFVTYDGSTKVVDFGIAKFQSRMSNTRAGTLKGKLAYMSPEQVHGEGIDRRTDIFALGVVLWELTTGQRLFRMDSDLDTLAKVQECNVPRPSTIVRGYPIDLEKIVMKALAKNRGERFRTAREFSRALQSLLMRRGLFIASDEVANYIQSIFQDRIQKREAHLRWAADVTQTINVDGMLGKPQLHNEGSLVTFNSEVQAALPLQGRAAQPPRPAAGMPPPTVAARAVRAPMNATNESASVPTAPRPTSMGLGPPVGTQRPPTMGGVSSPVGQNQPHRAPPPPDSGDVDDGPTIQAPPGMNPVGMDLGRTVPVAPRDNAATVQPVAGARAAMIAAMVAEEAAAAGGVPVLDDDDDDQDDTIVQTTRVDPAANRAAALAPAAGRPAPAPIPAAGRPAPLPAAGRPADRHVDRVVDRTIGLPQKVPDAGPVRPDPRLAPRASTQGMPPPPIMQRPDFNGPSPSGPPQHLPPPPPQQMAPPPNPPQMGAPHVGPPVYRQDELSHPHAQQAQPMAPPRLFAPSPSRDNRTVTAQSYRRRPPAWIVALGSAAAVLLIAAIVIGIVTTRRPTTTNDPTSPSASGLAIAPPSTTGSPSAAATAPPGGMGPFTSARAAFATAITPQPGAQLTPAPPVPPAPAPLPTDTATASATASATAAPTAVPTTTATAAAAGTTTATATATATPTSAPTAPRPTATAAPTTVATGKTPGAAGTGVLTVICFPACDHVFDNGRELGPSPVWQKQVQAGEHRLKLTTANPPATKILSVIVAADELKVIKQPMTQ